METDTTTETETVTENGGETESQVDTVSIPKADYEKLNQTVGSLKRELKDLKKPKEEPKETQQNQPDLGLLQKGYLRMAGITSEEEVELALSTAKKWGIEVDKLVDDEDFKVKLEKLRTQKSNELATSNIRGGQGTSQAKNTPEYWIAKGIPPTAADIPDRKTRQKINVAFLNSAKSGDNKKFYND